MVGRSLPQLLSTPCRALACRYAVGLAPSKDNYWSTVAQPGSPYHNDTEPRSRLQAAVLTLSNTKKGGETRTHATPRPLLVASGHAPPSSSLSDEPHAFVSLAAAAKGPVCPSDAVGHSDAALIMRSAMTDGRLLQVIASDCF